MRLENYVDKRRVLGASGLIFAQGDFGTVDGDAVYTETKRGGVTRYEHTCGSVTLSAEFTEMQNGVFVRRDCLYNGGDKDITLYALQSRFSLDGDAYEIYTQYNGWQNESAGKWQELVTEISARCRGIRTCEGATPVLAARSLYTGKTTVFHLLPNAEWVMTARKQPMSDKQLAVVECGFESAGLRLIVPAGESVFAPTLFFFEAKSRVDLDAYKLHEAFNALYPRRTLPVLYNSWLATFDNLDMDMLLREVDASAEIGVEAFMIDAGWFGKGDEWWRSVGDWYENEVSGPMGRLSELSDYVRKKGMIFGLWFEPERAMEGSASYEAHPDYYLKGGFLDFANEDARAFMIDMIESAITKYNIGWLKFDFNASIPSDPSGNAFYRYLEGQRTFVTELRERYPDMYITNCASGGQRMELMQATLFDSFWLSDNQGSLCGVDIVKNTLKRMPTGSIERWNVQKYCEGFLKYGQKERVGLMLTCNDATWTSVVRVDDSFTDGFLLGGPLGFSSAVSEFPEEYKEHYAALVARYKTEREFYRTATARVLVDTESITVIEYADAALSRAVVQVFTKRTFAADILVYPVLDKDARYLCNGEVLPGADAVEDGILIRDLKNDSCITLELEEIQ